MNRRIHGETSANRRREESAPTRNLASAEVCEQNKKCGSVGRPAPSTELASDAFGLSGEAESRAATGRRTRRREKERAPAAPLLVIAGAGSGKTNTLAHRVAHLIVNGADPRRILLMTFSRRAAAEMTRRVERICAQAMERRPGR